MATYPALSTFVLALAALLLKATLLSAVQVVARLRARTFLIPEDARLMRVAVVEREAPFVARCAAVWRNDLENIPFFLAAALAFTLSGGAANTAAWLFGAYVAVRIMHTGIYLRGLQPWRALAFLTGLVLTWTVVIATLGLHFGPHAI
ncbi:MAG: MAPEG family protein [Alphaproteobacteria bacterium]|nr:MAPEG family protein [Alphaproteobacteria bacterium]MBU4040407.1 MAPEG family protein [Alphaproteobacteria bacterium]MBU4137210.1 MAPEG family protein [Alphaproteobacteria bacterium]